MITFYLERAQRKRWALFFAFFTAFGLVGCQSFGLFEEPRALARALAKEHGFKTQHVPAGAFTIWSAFKGRRNAQSHLVVYIEGDGNSWKNRYVLSGDPTPLDPKGLRLAVLDPAPTVVYLARPCQYTTPATAQGCAPRYWAHDRFAEEVVFAIDRAVDRYKSVLGAQTVELVGYSGGGGVAVLVAARRDDVVGLTTVVGNLDHAAWTAHHDLTPLRGSLNPADFARRLQHLPQVHFVGGDDDTVPALVAKSYLARMTDTSRARLVEIPRFSHDCCWVRDWLVLRQRYAVGN